MASRHRAPSGRSGTSPSVISLAERPTASVMDVTPLLAAPAPTLFVPIGPAACGKTTLARHLALAFECVGRRLAVVSHEAVRLELFGQSNNLSDESRVGTRAQELLEQALAQGHDAYADRTNLVAPFRRQSLEGVRRACPEVYCVALLRRRNLSLTDLLARNAERAERDDERALVEPDVVRSHVASWARTTLAELFTWDDFAAAFLFDDDGVAALDPNGGLIAWT